jgi:AraC-like DNA-binding protein
MLNRRTDTPRSLQVPTRFQPALEGARWAPGASLEFLEPPYDTYRPVTLLAGARSCANSLILAVRLGGAVQACTDVRHVLARLAVLAPTAPRIVRLDSGADASILSHAFHLGRLHAHAIVVDDQDPLGALRPALTDSSMVACLIAEWLASRLRTLPHDIRAELAGRIADERSELTEGIASAWRVRLRRLRIPPPVQWTCLARAVHAARLIQAEPQRRIADVAFALGFEEASSLNALLARSFSLRPAELRGTLGISWLMDRWAMHNGLITGELFQTELKSAMRSYGIR